MPIPGKNKNKCLSIGIYTYTIYLAMAGRPAILVLLTRGNEMHENFKTWKEDKKMGHMKQKAIELAIDGDELDFNVRDADDLTWWVEQDAEMIAHELKQVEIEAEIHDYRINGYA